MSKTIDQKVVEMRFDNNQFEKGVSQTINSVSNLKKSLDFGNFASGMNSAVSGIGRGLDTIANRFTSLGVVATTALVEISRQAVNTGIDLIESLTVDQIAAGFEKYSQMAISTQTIMSATRKEWANESDQMDYVSGQLERLLWFTDETSYNFVDMVDSIGKFTSAGIDLDTAVTNIMGIATWAGLSGQNAMTASRAMYQLAQAAGKGFVQAIDWMSIEQANMSTSEFKNLLIDTAVAMGYLNQVFIDDYGFVTFVEDADSFVDELDLLENATIVTAENLRTTLAKKWLTTDVLSATLDEFGKFPDALSRELDYFNATIENAEEQIFTTEYMEYLEHYKKDMQMLTETSDALGISVSALKGYISDFNDGTLDLDAVAKKYDISVDDLTKELNKYKDGLLDLNEILAEYPGDLDRLVGGFNRLSSAEYDVGMAAFKASQESRTLMDAINYAKDAVSSGWMTTFQLIIGNLLEAKGVFARVSNELYEVFVEEGEARNATLLEWSKLGGREILLEGIVDSWENIKNVLFAVKDGFHDIFPKATADDLLKITETFRDFAAEIKLSEDQLDQVKKSVSDITGTFKVFGRNIKMVVAAFKSAWNKIFPTDQMRSGLDILNDITQSFSDFVEKHKMTGAQFARLERTLQGFFAVLDIISQLISAILKPLVGFDDTIGGIGDTVLATTAKIGDWLVSLDETIRTEDIFNRIRNKIIDVFDSIKQGFSDFKTGLDNFLQELTGKGLSGIWEDIKKFATDAGNDIQDFFNKFNKNDSDEGGEKLSLIARIFETLTQWVRDLKESFEEAKPYLDEFTQTFTNAFDTKSFIGIENLDELVRKAGAWGLLFGTLALIYEGWEEFQYQFMDGMNLLKNGLANINLIVEGLGEACWNLQKTVKVTIIEQIAAALLVMAISIAILASIKEEALGKAITAIVVIGAILTGIFETLMQLNSALDVGEMLSIGRSMKNIGFAILEVAIALAIVANAAEDPKTLYAAANALSGMIAVILLFYVLSTKIANMDTKKIAGLSASLVIVGAALLEISLALAILANSCKDPDTLKSSVEALAGILVAIGVFYVAMSALNVKAGKMVTVAASLAVVGAAMIEISLALAIIANACKDPDTLEQSVEALVGVLAAIGVFYAAMSTLKVDAGKIAGISASMILLSTALLLMAGAVSMIANAAANGGDIVKAGAILGGFMMVVGLFYAAMDKLNISASKILVISMSLILVGSALLIMANAIAIVASANPDNLAGAFVSLVLLLAAVGIALAGLSEMQGNIIGAAFALTLASVGIILLAAALKMLTEAGANLDTVVVLGAALLVVVGAAFLAEKVAPGMYALAIACAAIGAGALMAGAGMLKFAEGVQILYSLGPEGVDLLYYAIEHLGELIPGLVGSFIEGLGLIVAGFIENGSIVLQAVITLIEIILQAIIETAPMMMEVFKQLFLGTLDLIKDLTPYILSTLDFLTEQLLQSMMLITPKITAAAMFILVDTLNQIAANIGEITYLITDIALKVTFAVINAFIAHIPDFIDAGWKLTIALIEGMAASIDNNLEDLMVAMKHLGDAIIEGVCKVLGINSPSTKFRDIAFNCVLGMIQGFQEKLNDIVKKAKELGNKVVDNIKLLWADAANIGKNLVEGLINGINSMASDLWNAVTSMAGDAINAAKDKFEEHSPSKVFYDIGRYVDEGLIEGVNAYSKDVNTSTENMANGAIDSVRSVLSRINDEIYSDIDPNPTIRPILDLTNVTDGISNMDNMLYANRSINLASSSSFAMNRMLAIRNGTLMSDVADGLRPDVSNKSVQTNNFYIQSNNPKEVASEVSNILQTEVDRRNAVWA